MIAVASQITSLTIVYVMVTYSLRCVCGGRTATLVPQTVRRPYGFYANRTVTSWFWARRKVIASLAFFLLDIKLFQKPQYRNAATTPQGHRKVAYGRLAMAVRWHAVFTLSWVPRKSYGGLTASLRRPHGALTAAVRQTCNSHKNREVAARSPPVSLRSPYGFWSHESYDRRAFAVTFVTTTTAARKTLRFLKITLKSRRPQNRTAAAWYVTEALLNRLFRRRSKKTSKLGVTGLCEGNSLVTGEFPAQRASNAENVSIWWRHVNFTDELWSVWFEYFEES